MPARNTIEVIIKASDQASKIIDGIGGNLQNLGKVSLAAMAGVAGAAALAGKGLLDMAVDASSLDGIAAAFEGLANRAGSSAEDMLKALEKGSAGMIDQQELMLKYNTAAQLVGDTFAGQLPDAMQYLAKVSSATGEDMNFMLDSLVRGVGRLSPMILDNLGIQVDLNEAYEIYAASVGKSVDELTKQEQQTALMNVVMEKLAENTAAMPSVIGQTDTKLAALSAKWINFRRIIGTKVLPVLDKLVDLGSGVIDILNMMVTRDFKGGIFGLGEDHPVIVFFLRLRRAIDAIGAGVPIVNAFGIALVDTLESARLYDIDWLVVALESIISVFRNVLLPISNWINANIELKDILGAIGIAIASVIIPALWGIIAAAAPVILIFTGLVLLISTLRKAWENDFAGVRNIVNRFRDHLDETRNGVGNIFSNIKKRIEPLIRSFQHLAGALRRLFKSIDFGEVTKGLDFSKLFEIGRFIFGLFTPMGRIIDLFRLFGVEIDIVDIASRVINFIADMIDVFASGTEPVLGFQAAIGDALRGLVPEEVIGQVNAFVDSVVIAFNGIVLFVQQTIIPGLQMLAAWFLNDALPAVIQFVSGVAIPAIQRFLDALVNIWAAVSPSLASLGNWFIQDVLPQIVQFIQTVFIPIIQRMGQFIGDIWSIISPTLYEMADWFVNTGLPVIGAFISDTFLPIIQKIGEFIITLWDDISPILLDFLNWFTVEALPLIGSYINDVFLPIVNDIATVIADIWTIAQPYLQKLYDWFMTTGIPQIIALLQGTFTETISAVIKIVAGLWESVRTGVNNFKIGIQTAFNFLRTYVIAPLTSAIDKIKQAIQFVVDRIGELQTTLSGLQLPDWLTPGSPTPFEMGLRGINDALSQLNTQALPQFNTALPTNNPLSTNRSTAAATPSTASGGGQNSIQIIFQGTGGPTTQQEADEAGYMMVNGLRARGVTI